MNNFWYISGDFTKERSNRIGASDIPALIPDPERPTETLSGYGRTPVTVWQEKTGRKKRDPAGLPAEMGHYLEGKSIELFIRTFATEKEAHIHLHNRQALDFAQRATNEPIDAGAYQSGPFHHNVQYFNDGMIVHPDCVYTSGLEAIGKSTAMGVTVDFFKPFLVEAKSANFWSAKRPEGSIVRGYDLKLKTWQGIPLKHYMQIQFQLALLDVGTCYLSLIHDTSAFHVWQIKANKKHQAKLIDLAGKMAWHIGHDVPPKDMAINKQDVIDLYPELGDDFVTIEGEERDAAVEIAKKYRQAERQEKRWKEIKSDAQDAMAVLLKDRPELRDSEGIIAKWQERKGSERIEALSKIKDADPNAYKYLKRKNLLTTTKDSRSVAIKWDGEDA